LRSLRVDSDADRSAGKGRASAVEDAKVSGIRQSSQLKEELRPGPITASAGIYRFRAGEWVSAQTILKRERKERR
jgi:hypothetical protein